MTLRLIETELERKFVLASAGPDTVQVDSGWFALRHDHVSHKEVRRKIYRRWFVIRSKHGERIYRRLRFSPNLSLTEIAVDYEGWLKMTDWEGVTPSKLVLDIAPLRIIDYVRLPLRHLDESIRIAAWIAYASLLISTVSLIVSLLQFLA